MAVADQIVPDSEARGLVAHAPRAWRPYLLLARFDRPIGAWLLFWPGAWAIALAGGPAARLWLIGWFALGSVAMRAAGCVYNDIVDRDLDARVARTRMRPLASGAVSLKAAWAWLVALCLVGLIVLLRLNRVAQLTALASLALVAAYPFMKRITWWPQAWLGLVFSWGATVGWPAAAGGFAPAGFWLYAGSVAWVIGYDTIYAIQDIEDDALAGVKSSARALGRRVRLGVGIAYAVALGCWGAALWTVRPQWLALLALLPAMLHLAAQVARLRRDDGASALALFRSNRGAGALVFLACMVVGSAG
ncbi:MAG: 4-hydroxybenzoate octaprenyltransferase [Sphingomonadaceae bacterium]|nr:4-hydroxybenzoate octaprenyltransferase [Sphingomonadaceae bacterium]